MKRILACGAVLAILVMIPFGASKIATDLPPTPLMNSVKVVATDLPPNPIMNSVKSVANELPPSL